MLLLAFWAPKWTTLVKIGGEAEVVLKEVEQAAEVVEKVATVVEKVSEEMADKLSNDNKLKEAVLVAEHISQEAVKDAHIAEDIIHKMGDWSMLPSDVLGEIALKLEQLEDFVYFSVVCQSWNYASSLVKPNWNFDKVTPWLLLAENKIDNNPDCYRKLYNLSYNKCYQLKLPETFGLRCWGLPFGWIAIQTLDFQLHLFNPLTKVRITSFPPILSLDVEPYEPDDPIIEQRQKQWFFHSFVKRFVVFKMPRPLPLDDGNGDDELVVAVLYQVGDGRQYHLAIARPGDQAWTWIVNSVEDVVYWRDAIYILRYNSSLSYCDMKRSTISSDDLKDVVVKVVDYVPKFFSEIDGLDKFRVLDLCGDLVMVRREKKSYDRYPFYKTSHFTVFRLDNKAKKWVQIKDIGNYSIFVGTNTSMAVPISMANNYCLRNSIYFTDDESMFWREVPGGRDMGVYNICSGDIIPFYRGIHIHSKFCPPLFFKPKC